MRLKLLALLAVLALVGLGSHQALASIEGPPQGEPASVANQDGEEIAQISVSEVQDPFEDFGEFSEPDPNTRYVAYEITVDNTGERPFEFSPYDIFIVDSAGRTYGSTYVGVDDDFAEDNPELEERNMSPGEDTSGLLYFVIWEDAEITDVLYQSSANDTSVLVSIADLGSGRAATGGTHEHEEASPAADEDEDSSGASVDVKVDDDEEDATPES